MYKPSETHVVIDALSKLLGIIETIGVLHQTTDAKFFSTQSLNG
jgi:hypothetical protein